MPTGIWKYNILGIRLYTDQPSTDRSLPRDKRTSQPSSSIVISDVLQILINVLILATVQTKTKCHRTYMNVCVFVCAYECMYACIVCRCVWMNRLIDGSMDGCVHLCTFICGNYVIHDVWSCHRKAYWFIGLQWAYIMYLVGKGTSRKLHLFLGLEQAIIWGSSRPSIVSLQPLYNTRTTLGQP